jgi:two-component system sensor histidine kinase ChiS
MTGLSNAVKFTPKGSTIFISIKADSLNSQAALCFSLQGEGFGIPRDELDTIFDKFIQSSKTKTNAGGTGLGLAICKEIIGAHQGRIWAENALEGGAIFRFVIPCSNKIEPTKKTNVGANSFAH